MQIKIFDTIKSKIFNVLSMQSTNTTSEQQNIEYYRTLS